MDKDVCPEYLRFKFSQWGSYPNSFVLIDTEVFRDFLSVASGIFVLSALLINLWNVTKDNKFKFLQYKLTC